MRFATQITCTVASSDVSSSVIWDPSLSKVQWDQETQTQLSPARAAGGSAATSLPPSEVGVAARGGWEQSYVHFPVWVPWFGLSLTNTISFQSESQCLVRDGERRFFGPKPTALPLAPSSSPSERGVVTKPASLLHDTLRAKQGEQRHRSLTCTWRVPHTHHHICPEAPPTGLVTPLPWTRTLDCGHMLVMRQGLEPSHMAAEWIVFPSAHSLSPSFPGAKKVSLRSTGAGHPHRPSSFPLRNSQVGLWDSGFSGRCRITVCRAVPARPAGLLICAVTEVWGAGLKGGRFDPRSR